MEINLRHCYQKDNSVVEMIAGMIFENLFLFLAEHLAENGRFFSIRQVALGEGYWLKSTNLKSPDLSYLYRT